MTTVQLNQTIQFNSTTCFLGFPKDLSPYEVFVHLTSFGLLRVASIPVLSQFYTSQPAPTPIRTYAFVHYLYGRFHRAAMGQNRKTRVTNPRTNVTNLISVNKQEGPPHASSAKTRMLARFTDCIATQNEVFQAFAQYGHIVHIEFDISRHDSDARTMHGFSVIVSYRTGIKPYSLLPACSTIEINGQRADLSLLAFNNKSPLDNTPAQRRQANYDRLQNLRQRFPLPPDRRGLSRSSSRDDHRSNFKSLKRDSSNRNSIERNSCTRSTQQNSRRRFRTRRRPNTPENRCYRRRSRRTTTSRDTPVVHATINATH
jgi:hypothetical protein